MAYQEQGRSEVWNTKLTANDSVAKEVLGTIRETQDGRAYRYVKMTGGTSALGQVNAFATPTAITNLTQSTTIGPDGASTTLITDSDAAWTPDQYVGYYYKTDTGKTGTPDPVKIVANTATTLTLERTLSGTAMAAGGTDDGEIIPPAGIAVIAGANDLVQNVAGVGIGTLSQNYYGWLQIRGMAAVLSDAITEQGPVSPGGNAAGQAINYAAVTDTVIGYCVAASGADELGLVYLTIV